MLPFGSRRPMRACSTRSASRTPDGSRSSPRPCRSSQELGLPHLGLGRRVRCGKVRGHVPCARRAGGRRLHRAQPLVPERRRGAGVGRRDRCVLPARDGFAPLCEALSGRAGRRRARSRGRGRRGRRPLSREHDPRPRARRAVCVRCSARPRVGTRGPTLKPIALAAVHAAFRATELPIVGMGGVSTGRDALELLGAGASAVALGTVLFTDPDAPQRVREELDAEVALLGYASSEEARGVAHPAAASPNA